MSDDQLKEIRDIQKSNARAIQALADSQRENSQQINEVSRTINEVGRQINQLRSDLLQVANDFHGVAAANNQTIYENNQKIAQNNQNITAILQYLQSQVETKNTGNTDSENS